MWEKNKQFWLGLSIMVGTIVGVGIFGLPYAVAQSGFGVGLFYLLFLGLASTLLHLFYGEFVLRTEGKHRLVGYSSIYLGKPGRFTAAFATLFGLYGSLLAYIIVAGRFLHLIFGDFFGGTPFVYSILFFIISSMIIYLGAKLIAGGELIMTAFLIFIVFLIFFKGLPYINLENLTTVSAKDFFLPYGVILFSLAGVNAIPELGAVIEDKKKNFKKVIFWGTVIPIILYVFFMLTVVGISGVNTSTEAISGLAPFLGQSVVLIGSIFGFLAVTTSYFVIGLNLKETFWYDYGINHFISWVLTISIPFIVFVAGIRSFIQVVDIVGVIMGGLSGILIVLIYKKAKKYGQRVPEYSLPNYPKIGWFLIMVFVLAIIYEMVYLFQ